MIRRTIAAALAFGAVTAFAQSPQDPRPLIAEQKEAMAPLGFMDGVWRGMATTVRPAGHALLRDEARAGGCDRLTARHAGRAEVAGAPNEKAPLPGLSHRSRLAPG